MIAILFCLRPGFHEMQWFVRFLLSDSFSLCWKLQMQQTSLSLDIMPDDECISKCVKRNFGALSFSAPKLWLLESQLTIDACRDDDKGSYCGFWTSTLVCHMDSLMDKSRLNEHYFNSRNNMSTTVMSERSGGWSGLMRGEGSLRLLAVSSFTTVVWHCSD